MDDIYSQSIEYPVIIKPVDCASSVGVTPCFTPSELEKGYEKARKASKSGDVIVEQFLPYDEINLTYIAQDGDIQLAAVHDRYFNTEQKSATKVYCYEAGMRLNGCKTYQILEYENDYNTFEHLMEFALTGSMGKHVRFNPKFKRWYATLNVLGIPGATIASVKGEKELNSYPWLVHIARRDGVGHTIPADSAGTLVQDTTRIHVTAETKEALVDRIDKVNELFKMLDEEGNSVLLKPHNTAEVLKALNYDL